MPTFKIESRNAKEAVMDKFTVIASNLDKALALARADQEEQWKGCDEDVRITSIVETAERVISEKGAPSNE